MGDRVTSYFIAFGSIHKSGCIKVPVMMLNKLRDWPFLHFTDFYNPHLPIIPHEVATGTDCCGCLIVRVRGDQADITCNECGAVIRTGHAA